MFVKMKNWFKFFIFASVISAALFVNNNDEISTSNGMQKSNDIINNSTMKTANSDNTLSTINNTNVNNLTTGQSAIIKLQEISKNETEEITISTPEIGTINQEIITELNEKLFQNMSENKEQTNNEIENEITTTNFDLNSETTEEATTNYESFSDITTETSYYSSTENSQYKTTNNFETDTTTEIPYYINTEESTTADSSEMNWITESNKFDTKPFDLLIDYSTVNNVKKTEITTDITTEYSTSTAKFAEISTDSTIEHTTTDISDTTNFDSSKMFWYRKNKQFYKNLEYTTPIAEYSEITTEITDSTTEVPYYTTTDISDTTEETASTDSSKMFWYKKNKEFYKNQEYSTPIAEYSEITIDSTTEVPYYTNAEEYTEYFEAKEHSTDDTNLLEEKQFYMNNILTTDFPSTSTNFILNEYSNAIEDTTLESTTETYSLKSIVKEEAGETKPTEPSSEHCAENIKITDLKVNPSNYSIFVNWSKPLPDCDYKYIIQWEPRFEKIQSVIVIDTAEYLINNLNACEEYKINVGLLYQDKDITSSSIKATTLESIEPVEYMNNTYYENEKKLSVFWKIPQRVRNCLKKYYLKIFKDDVLTETLSIRDDNVTFGRIKDCVSYTYVVSACSEKYVSQEQNTTHLKTIVNSLPIFNEQETEIHDDYVITKWNFGKIVCKPTKFSISCYSNSDEREEEEGQFDVNKNELTSRIDKVRPYENYTCAGMIENKAGSSGSSEPGIFLTKSKPPTTPSNLNITEPSNEYIYIEWDEPKKWNGVPLHYNLLIEFIKLNYMPSKDCEEPGFELINKTLDSSKEEYIFMDYMIAASTYKISVIAQSDGGWSEHISESIVLKDTSPESPNIVLQLNNSENINYNTSVNVSWTEPCGMNGILTGYNIQLINNFDIIEEQNISIEENKMWYIFKELKPDSEYIIQIFARNERFDGEIRQKSFTTPAGIPPAPSTNNVKKPSTSDVKEPWKSAAVYITEDIFDKSMGEIIYYSVIVATAECKESRKKGIYDSNKWPQVSSDSNCANELKPYEATDQKWNPFIKSAGKSSNIFKYTLGENDSCTKNNNCNKPLKSNTEYYVKIRGFTKNGFSDTDLLSFITDSDVPVGLIVGLIVGILVIAFIIAAVLFYTKGKLNFKNWPRMESTAQISPAPLPISIKKFGPHYEKMIENPGKIKNEFQLLSTISSDVTLSTKTALLPINKKKNRYINILPYDQTRVKLIDTKANSSDYINASYIKGYSGSNEYIAAQGPTETTCPAFWQMILEQNIKIIVMLTQCVEAGKDKCYKYFPDLKEEYDLLNDIKIICVEEQTLSLYNLRTLVIKKKNVARKIIHMQFTMWPDFGVPDTVQHMINFCEVVRSAKMKKPSIILMHCSAGVGRTGTLIAVDILLQTIRDKRKVDIFGSVLNLRKQRMQMVQSERQYEFLYKCVQYMITNKTTAPTIKNNLHNISESNML